MAEIVNKSWSLFQRDGAAVFQLSLRSPFPPGMSAQDLTGGRSQVLNVPNINRIDHRPAKYDKDIVPDCIADTNNWYDWNGDLGNPNDREVNLEADNESDKEQENGIGNSDSPALINVSAIPDVARLM